MSLYFDMRFLALILLVAAVPLLAQDEPPDRVKLRFEPQSGQILHTRTSESHRIPAADGKAIDAEVTTAFTARFDEVTSRDQFNADVVIEELTGSMTRDAAVARIPELETPIVGRHFKATYGRLSEVQSITVPQGAERMQAEVKNIITRRTPVPMFETLFIDEPVTLSSQITLLPGIYAHLDVTTTLKSIEQDGPDYVGKMEIKWTGSVSSGPAGPSATTIKGNGTAEWNINHSFLRAFSGESRSEDSSEVIFHLRMTAFLDGTEPPR